MESFRLNILFSILFYILIYPYSSPLKAGPYCEGAVYEKELAAEVKAWTILYLSELKEVGIKDVEKALLKKVSGGVRNLNSESPSYISYYYVQLDQSHYLFSEKAELLFYDLIAPGTSKVEYWYSKAPSGFYIGFAQEFAGLGSTPRPYTKLHLTHFNGSTFAEDNNLYNVRFPGSIDHLRNPTLSSQGRHIDGRLISLDPIRGLEAHDFEKSP